MLPSLKDVSTHKTQVSRRKQGSSLKFVNWVVNQVKLH